MQGQVVARIIGAVEPTLRSAEIAQARQKPDAALTAHDLYLRSAPTASALRADDNSHALGYLDRALALDHPRARASLPIHDSEILETILQSLSEDGLRG